MVHPVAARHASFGCVQDLHGSRSRESRSEGNAAAEAEAFWAGVYNTSTTEYYGNISVKIKDVQPGYQWYVLSAKWPPHSTDYIWMGPPRFHNNVSAVEAVYLDRIEMIENK